MRDDLTDSFSRFLAEPGIEGFPLRRCAPVCEECDCVRLFSFRDEYEIDLVPVSGLPLNQWPVAWRDRRKGTGSVFSSSVEKWFPSFLIFIRTFEGVSGALRRYRSQITDYARVFGADTERMLEMILDENNFTYDRELYELSEPGTFLHWYNVLIHDEYDDDEMTGLGKLRRDFPFYNRPLRVFIDDDLWDESVAEDILTCHMRWDLGDDPEALLDSVLSWKRSFISRPDDPLDRFLSLRQWNFTRAGETFLEAGDIYRARGDSARACALWDNALLFQHRINGAPFPEATERLRAAGNNV